MKVLFIGGTGTISGACARLAIKSGLDVTLLTRGRRATDIAGAEILTGDITLPSVADVLKNRSFDAVVNWIVYTPEEIERDAALFRGKTTQYIFISSASAYEKPPRSLFQTEETPLRNPFWNYSHLKILCETRLRRFEREEGFPITIVRPSHTYGPQTIPAAFNNSAHPWTIIQRLRQGKPVIVHGDGTSLWTLTHADDFARGFVPLLGNPAAVGEAFHITSDEVLSWDAITHTVARAAGVEAKIVHVSSDTLHALTPGGRETLLGDKMHCSLYDNSKIRKLAPDFRCDIPFADGVRRSIAWFEADAKRQTVDKEFDAVIDRIIARVS